MIEARVRRTITERDRPPYIPLRSMQTISEKILQIVLNTKTTKQYVDIFDKVRVEFY